MLRPMRFLLPAFSAGALLLAGCGDSTTEPGGESEVISRVTLTLTPPAGAALTSFIDDADGNGPGAPSAQQGALTLARNTTYTGTIRFENRLATPVEDITTEVQAEANEHRVFYTASGSGVTITTTDTDGQGRPLGLRFTTAVGATAAPGQISVVLCHYDKVTKPAAATSCTVETDISVAFAFTIQP